MSLPDTKSGNLFLLFHDLPYDFAADLPLPLGHGVCLDVTPQAYLDSAEPGLADYLLPGYSLPGMGLNNCCLRCFVNSHPIGRLSAEDLFFLSLLALRLHAPIGMRIGGQFRLGDEGDRILDPKLYELSSPWCGGNSRRYTPTDIAVSSKIVDRLVAVEQLGLAGLQTSLVFFSQVTIGLSQSYQLSYLGLFAALEALFVPDGNKAATLSSRIENFLSDFQFPEQIGDWIKGEYINGRGKLVHGMHDATFGTKLRPKRYQDFGRLHEITRLSLLGFLSFGDHKLDNLFKSSGKKLQNALDSLNPASGPFLGGQTMWLD